MIAPTLHIAHLSDTGRVRRHNEDHIGCDEALGLLVLADGMGGYQAGEIASEIAVNEILQTVRDTLLTQDTEAAYRSQAPALLRQAVLRANQAIFQAAMAEEDYYGMGTTVVTMLFYGQHACIAHVGDSRLYRLRGGQFEQLTVDHSVLQELIEQGFYTREEARFAPNKNLVTRALGVGRDVQVDVQEIMIEAHDVYLLCSDGLNDMLDDRSIQSCLNPDNLTDSAHQLVMSANRAGGEDNISVVLAKLADSPVAGEMSAQQKGWWQRWWGK